MPTNSRTIGTVRKQDQDGARSGASPRFSRRKTPAIAVRGATVWNTVPIFRTFWRKPSTSTVTPRSAPPSHSSAGLKLAGSISSGFEAC